MWSDNGCKTEASFLCWCCYGRDSCEFQGSLLSVRERPTVVETWNLFLTVVPAGGESAVDCFRTWERHEILCIHSCSCSSDVSIFSEPYYEIKDSVALTERALCLPNQLNLLQLVTQLQVRHFHTMAVICTQSSWDICSGSFAAPEVHQRFRNAGSVMGFHFYPYRPASHAKSPKSHLNIHAYIITSVIQKTV